MGNGFQYVWVSLFRSKCIFSEEKRLLWYASVLVGEIIKIMLSLFSYLRAQHEHLGIDCPGFVYNADR